MMGRRAGCMLWVHCRAGSLEKILNYEEGYREVHCRTGSLVTERESAGEGREVHCRTGSLKVLCVIFYSSLVVLPHR
ncbi:hypothetical protein ACUXI4_001758 [Pantoea piersonii]